MNKVQEAFMSLQSRIETLEEEHATQCAAAAVLVKETREIVVAMHAVKLTMDNHPPMEKGPEAERWFAAAINSLALEIDRLFELWGMK